MSRAVVKNYIHITMLSADAGAINRLKITFFKNCFIVLKNKNENSETTVSGHQIHIG